MPRRNTTKTPRPTTFEPVIHIPAIKVAQPDGSIVVRPGKPEVLKGEDEISPRDFAEATSLSHRRVLTLIDEGHIKARPMSPAPNARWRIPRSELARYLKLEKE